MSGTSGQFGTPSAGTFDNQRLAGGPVGGGRGVSWRSGPRGAPPPPPGASPSAPPMSLGKGSARGWRGQRHDLIGRARGGEARAQGGDIKGHVQAPSRLSGGYCHLDPRLQLPNHIHGIGVARDVRLPAGERKDVACGWEQGPRDGHRRGNGCMFMK